MLSTISFFIFITFLILTLYFLTPAEEEKQGCALESDGVILYGIIGENPFDFIENMEAPIDEWRKILSSIDPSMRSIFRICTADYLIKYARENYYLELGKIN